MSSLRVHPDRLEIQLSAAEKALALRREDLSVPRTAIRSVTITDDPWIWIRGIRAPGTLVPLVLAIGTWKFHGGKDFLIIKNKRQAVIIDVADQDYARLIVSTNHAAELVNTLNVAFDDTTEQTTDAVDAVGSAAAKKAKPARTQRAPKAPKAPKVPRAARAAAGAEAALTEVAESEAAVADDAVADDVLAAEERA